jgi:hypothetical protein
MSVLFSKDGPALRYFHAAGLIMRHDKETFAVDAIDAARTGKLVGDIVRVMTFTSYAKVLPWEVPRIKSLLDPFTGCFISRLPFTVSWLRLALTAASLFMADQQSQREQGSELVRMGTARLTRTWKQLGVPEAAAVMFNREKEGWDLYYDLLDELEKGLAEGEPFAIRMRDHMEVLVHSWKVM